MKRHPANENNLIGLTEVMDNYIVLLYTVLAGIEIMIPLLHPDELKRAEISLKSLNQKIENIYSKL